MNLITDHKEIVEFILIFIFFIIYLKFSIDFTNYIDKIEKELKMLIAVQMTNGKTHIVDGGDIFSNAEGFANAICGNNLLNISVNYIEDVDGEVLLTNHIVSIKDQK